MKLTEAAYIVEAAILNNLSLAGKNARDPQFIIPYLEGKPGLGKTTLVVDICKKLGVGCKIVSLSQYDPAEIAGWLIPNADHSAMIRLRPDWMPVDGNGVVYLDELPQAITANQNIAAQIVNERRVGEHRLPEGWTVVGAGNQSKDRAGTNHMPTHLRDRMTFLEVEADMDDVLAYFAKNGVDPRVIAFLRFSPKRLHEFDRDANACPSPRSWERVSTIINLGLNDLCQAEAVAGTVGRAAAVEFNGYIKVFHGLPSFDDIVKHPDTTTMPADPAVLYALSASLSSKVTSDNAPAVMKYMNRSKNKEFIVFMLVDAFARDPSMATVPEISDFMMNSGMLIDR